LQSYHGIEGNKILIAGIGFLLCSMGILYVSFSDFRHDFQISTAQKAVENKTAGQSDAEAAAPVDPEQAEAMEAARNHRENFKEKCDRGTEAAEHGDYISAMVILGNAIALAPRDAIGWALRGRVYAELGRDRAAIEDFNMALDIDPECIEAITGRAMLWLDYRRLGQALSEMNRAAAIAPERHDIYTDRAYLYQALRKPSLAIADLDRAIELGDPYPQTVYRRAKMKIKAARYEEAVADLDLVIEKLPGRSEPIFHRGLIEFRTERYERAIEDFDRAIELSPDGASYHAARAEALRKLGREEEAIATQARARELGALNWGKN